MRVRGRVKSRVNRRGAAVTEMALVLPMLLLLALGIIEWGSVMFVRNNMLHAAREGCRAFAVRNVDEAGAIAITETNLTSMNFDFDVTASPDSDPGEERWIEITTEWSEVAMGDPLRLFSSRDDLTVRVTMRRED